MSAISPTLPNNISALDLPSHYQSVRERMMNGRERPKPTLVRIVPRVAPKPVFQPVVMTEINRPLSIRSREIMAQIVDKHGVSKEAIKSQCRSYEIVRARQELCYRLREECSLTYPQIAAILGYEDHTTPLYGYRQYKKRLQAGGDL